MRKKHNHKPNGDVIRNIPAFIAAYLKSESGQKALTRGPIRVGKGKEAVMVWRNPAIAVAFQEALYG